MRMFHETPSVYLWEDATGTVHTQSDALMPLLFSVGQHSSLRDGEHLFAFLDDIYTATLPDRVGAVHACLGDELRTRERSTSMEARRKCGIKLACDLPSATSWNALQERTTPRARVWTGFDVPTEQQGFKVFGSPLGHPDFIRQHLSNVHEDHQRLLTSPLLADMQSTWLFLVHCAQARANFLIRAVRPEAVEEFAVVCGGVWARFWGLTSGSAKQGCCGGVGAQIASARTSQSLSGPAGRMRCHWWARATQKLLLSWFVTWKATLTLPAWQRLGH